MPNMRGVVPALLGCAIVGGTAFQTWQFEQNIDALRAADDRLTRQYASLEAAVADLKTAQAGYVAAGQSAAAWISRADDLMFQIDALLSDRRESVGPDATAALNAAYARLEAVQTSDRRARNYVRNEQHLLASDVVFAEAHDILGRLVTEASTARDTERLAGRQEAATIRQYQAALVGGAGLALLLLVGFVAFRRIDVPDAVVSAASSIAPPVEHPKPEAPRTTTVRSPGLDQAADVCVDLARLLDGRDLPALLARSAEAIGARGLVLWVIDDARVTLQPSLAHGYSDRTVQRLGTLPVSADNVTSVACRTMTAQIVPAASADASGALAVPLIGASGCVGVLAAEVTGTAGDGSTLPLARVIAAQLAAIITPVPTVSSETAMNS